MAYRMARLPVTVSDAEGHFCCLNLCDTHNLGNVPCFNYNVFTHKLEIACGS